MITAAEARALTEAATLKYHLDRAEKAITVRSTAGYIDAALKHVPGHIKEQIKAELLTWKDESGKVFTVKDSDHIPDTLIINW